MKRPNMPVQGQGFVQSEELSQQYFAAIIPVSLALLADMKRHCQRTRTA